MSFIVAENPMQSTGKLFWKMIIDFKIPVIVMLGNTKEIGMVCKKHNYFVAQTSALMRSNVRA